MKKTTVRFAAVGTVLLLGALAIALAQHDSRQRVRDTPSAAKPASAAPQPILVDAIEPTFPGGALGQALHAGRGAGQAAESAEPLVRANDNSTLGEPPSLAYEGETSASLSALKNPLRSPPPASADETDVEPLGALEDSSAVALASGEEELAGAPPSLPTLPGLAPALGAQPLPVQAAASASPSLPGTSASPAAPSGLPNTAPAAASSTLGGAPPGWVNSGPITPDQKLSHQSLSDTQRPAMPVTSLPRASRGGGQSWLQAPSTSGPGAVQPGIQSLPGGTAANSANANPAATRPVGTSPVGLSASGSQPLTPPPSAVHSRLSDDPPEAAGLPAAEPSLPQTPGSLPPAQGLGSPLGATPSPLGSRPLPSAPLGMPQLQPPPPGGPSALPQQPVAGAAPIGAAPVESAPIGSAALGSLPSAPPSGLNSAQPRAQLTSGSARSLLAGTALGALVSNQPGNRHLDGSQNPIMLIQKRTAGECQVGKRATIVITVRNSGNATAHGVQVIDSVPSGASFAEAMPAVTPTPDGVLTWELGEMAPGDERTINLQIIPERQGELGSVASVRFAAQASVRTLATLPKLELAYTAAPDVLIGSQHAIDVAVKNVGTGVARNVRLEADLPASIRHESGDAGLEASFGDIAPGESKHIRLNSIAAEAGQAECAIRALTDDGLQQEQKIGVRVLAPALQASINGPSKRYLDRQATFEVMIQNTGTASATGCEFVLRLPAGLNFNTANKHGTYDPDQHAVLWSVPEFPAGHTEAVELTVLPVEAGTLAMSFQAVAELGIKTEAHGELTVEEQAELAFTIEQDADPIELSASTTYTVEVRNVGRADRNVQVTAQLPPGSKILRVDAPVKYSIQGDQLLFEPVPEMASRAEHKFRFEVQHAQAGTQIVRAQLKSQNRPTAVIKEEATDVYNDRN